MSPRTVLRVRPIWAPLVVLAFVVLFAPAAHAQPLGPQERLCDPSFEDCRADILTYIQQEQVGIDVGFWMMNDARYSNALVAAWNRGVRIRLLMDPRCMDTHAHCEDPMNQLAGAGIPMRRRATSGILHWKMFIFAGQQQVEFSGANLAPFELTPETPYVNYTDEVVYYTNEASVVSSFMTKFDDLWTSPTEFVDYANVTGPLLRSYPTSAIDPDLSFPPDDSYRNRAIYNYNHESQKIDVFMFRITDVQHTNAILAAINRGVPVRLLTDETEYRNPSRLWDAYNVDIMYHAGVQVRLDAHQGINHEKAVLLYGLGMSIFGSSNWTSPSTDSQREHNYFTTKPWIFQWLEAQFQRKWTNSAGYLETKAFVPLPPGQPVYASPANGATEQPYTGMTLAWDAGLWGQQYDIYLGVTPNPPLLIANQQLGPSQYTGDNRSYELPALEPGTTYYWKIVSKTMAYVTAEGPVWSFTTQGPPPPPPAPPSTGVASAITQTGATLNGTANPNGVATTARFQYGPTTSYGYATPTQSLGSGTTSVAIGGGAISSLVCGTVYHFRAVATNAGGTTNGADATFTTSSCPPTVATGAASAITQTGATLNGTANPNGTATTARFEYGLTAGYGSSTPTQTLGSGSAALAIGGGGIASLTCGTLYHFRAVATNTQGTTNGTDATFTTSACPPAVVTGVASAITQTGATLNGTANPNGAATTANFEYGLTASYGSSTPTQALGSGSVSVAIGAGDISSLTCGTLYHFRAVATSASGTTNGLDATFTTASCPPAVATGGASAITQTGATLNGTANPNGTATTAHFEYGLTASYGSATADVSLGSGSASVAIGGGAISSLTCGTLYHFRAVAANTQGTTNGTDATFTTSACPPAAVTGVASAITQASATLNGTANPNGTATTAHFEYGLTASYGSTTADASVGSGSASVAIGGGAVSGLACGTLYHFRAVATNTGGTTNGTDATFTTATCPPAVVTGVASAITQTAATLNGTANPNGTATTAHFEYGLTASYGSATPSQTLGSGSAAVAIGGGSISGLTCGTIYHVRAVATNTGGTTNGADATFTTSACSPPAITAQPQSQTIASGQTATMSVAATGSPTLTYQWYVGTSGTTTNAIAGATSSSYTTPPLSSTTSYWVRVTNPYSTADSNTAVISVTPPCTFSLSAPSASVPSGATTGSVTLTASASSCAWTAVSNNGFIAVTSPGAGTGTTTVTWSVTGSRITSPRTGTITIAGLTFTITQAGALVGHRVPNDFNRDGLTDLGLFRPSLGRWVIDGQPAVDWGAAGDIPVPGDYDGDGRPDLAVFRPSNGSWYIYGGATIVWGSPGDIPVPGDYDGNGTTDIAVFRPATGAFYIRNGATIPWGLNGDLPVVGDYNGDGIDDIAVYRPATGTWYVRNITTAVFGSAADIPVPADYNGDGTTDIAVFRPATGTWLVKDQYTQVWGAAGDVPVPLDRNGDGLAEPGVFRRATGTWYFKNHATGASETVSLGMAGDIPLNRAMPPVQTKFGDYDGDRKADLTVFRPSTGVWVSLRSLSGTDYTQTSWGLNGDVPAGRDYDGDGKIDFAVFRPSLGRWLVLQSSTSYSSYIAQDWGVAGDIPVAGDYDGDGKADFAVFRPSIGRWVILLSSTGNTSYVQYDWGLDGDIPVPADYDGDGRTDLAVFRPSAGRWYILNRITGAITTRDWGLNGDVPISADFDGDGKADIAVFRPSLGRWFITSSIDGTYEAIDWGLNGDVVVPADYDGDGKADLAVFRPSTGMWYVRGLFNRSWGLNGDIPTLKNP